MLMKYADASETRGIIGIDQDAAAIEAAGNRLKDFGESCNSEEQLL